MTCNGFILEFSLATMPSILVLPDGMRVDIKTDETILQACKRVGMPITHICGGKARCSTCRVHVLEGLDHCEPRTVKECAMAERLGFGPELRLACQTRVRGDIRLRRLVLDASDIELTNQARADAVATHIGEERLVAVMFADIRDFTSMAEALPAYDVIHFLNRFFREMTKAVESHGGVVSNIVGDGMLSVFDLECTQAASVIDAGMDMLSRVDGSLSAYVRAIYGRELRVGLGAHCGEVIIGRLAGSTCSLAAIGDTVNVASRIEAANKQLGTRFLISSDLHALAKCQIRSRLHRGVNLPGKAGSCILHEVQGWRKSYPRDE